MFLDFSRTSTGTYAVFATVTGSMFETVYTQVGRNYQDAQPAAKAAFKMALDSHRFKDVTLKNLVTKQVFYIDIQLARQYFKEQQDAPQVPARARSKGRCHSYL